MVDVNGVSNKEEKEKGTLMWYIDVRCLFTASNPSMKRYYHIYKVRLGYTIVASSMWTLDLLQ